MLTALLASAALALGPEETATSRAAQDQYDLNFIGFDEGVTTPFQGKYRKPLEGVDFYKALGRQDLLALYQQRNGLRWTLLAGGVVGMMAGTVVPASILFLSDWDGTTRALGYLISGGVFLTGLLFYFIGTIWSPDPVTPSEARQLADEHNVDLRKKLGLPLLQASLEIGGDQLGLRLSGAF